MLNNDLLAPLLEPNQTLLSIIDGDLKASGGWMGFDAFMVRALYTPGLGYYANSSAKFGTMPAGVKGEGSTSRCSAP